MTLIVDTPLDGPGTHVFIVGVGKYPYFPGHVETNDVGQIDSAELGARQVAKWFKNEFHNPDMPLASLRVLFSDPDGADFAIAGSIEAPTWSNFRRNYQEWFDASEKNTGSTMVFYFSGHGIGTNNGQALLLEDYYEDSRNPMYGAVHYNNLNDSTRATSNAKNLWFFLDTCQSATIAQTASGFLGQPVHSNFHSFKPCASPAFVEISSASEGQNVFGSQGIPSFFSSAIVAAFGTNAFIKHGKLWKLTPNSIASALEPHLRRIYLREKVPSSIVPTPRYAFTQSNIALHLMQQGKMPRMIVDVTCSEQAANLRHDLYWAQQKNTSQTVRTTRNEDCWSVDLEPDVYDFGAIGDDKKPYGMTTESITYPYSNISLEIS